MSKYIMYLRKSRSDSDYSSGDETEVLKRHESQLYALAERMNIPASEIEVYREIVSADTISQRPMMQKLLRRIEDGDITGVLVVEVQRLARGDTMDQGIVSRAFKLTNTLIITLNKTYDPNNSFDEDFFEFGLFMSRRELKTIKERLNRGRKQSVLEGKWVASHTPYGYDKEKLKGEKGYKLIINKEEAAVVRMIFDIFTEAESGTQLIAGRLNQMGFKPRMAVQFSPSIVRRILDNPVYIGTVVWDRRKGVQMIKNGEVVESHPWNNNYISAPGLHEPIISREQWNKAQELRNRAKSHKCPRQLRLKNPLASLIKCKKCNHYMQLRTDRGTYKYLMCYTVGCKSVATRIEGVEAAVLDEIRSETERYRSYIDNYSEGHKKFLSDTASQISSIDMQIAKLQKQLEKICISYEQDIYSVEVYRSRTAAVNAQLQDLNQQRDTLTKTKPSDNIEEYLKRIPLYEHILEIYATSSVEEKNNMLKSIIDYILYEKNESGRHDITKRNSFSIDVYFKNILK
ncbi:MAG: recombinase family protein [bacterium]|nr:recombinase family protein [bacterium]